MYMTKEHGGRFKELRHMYFKAGPDPGTTQHRQEMGPPAPPQIWSDCPRKSFDFEIGVGGRLGTLRVH